MGGGLKGPQNPVKPPHKLQLLDAHPGQRNGLNITLPWSDPLTCLQPCFPSCLLSSPSWAEDTTEQCPPQRHCAPTQGWTPSWMHLPVPASMFPSHPEAS